MSNTFERHKIKHLSASSLNLWSVMPGLWVMRYLCGFKDEMGPAASRGNAVELALLHILHGAEFPVDVALRAFDLAMMGELSDKIDSERALIPGMVAQCETWRPPSELLASQIKIECFIDGLSVPIIGYVDFSFTDCDVDLKTTKQCPSKPKSDHVRQVSLYRHARSKKGKLLYVTNKKTADFDVTDEMRDAAIEEISLTAASLESFLNSVEEPIDALKRLPIDRDNFRWSGFAEKQYRRVLKGPDASGFDVHE